MADERPAAIRDELKASVLVPSLTQGVVLGVLEVVVATSFAALVFAGPLAVHVPAGIGLALFSAAAVLIVIALLSSLPGTVGSVQDSTAAVLALVAAGIALRLPPEAPETFLTVVLAVGLTALLAGLLFLVLGAFRLGDLVRFVPYPVVGGFLAGTGWLLATGGLGVLTGLEVSLRGAGELLTSGAVAKWLPGLLFALIMLFLLRRLGHFLLIPGLVVGGVVTFYVVMSIAGLSVGEAEAGGWLLGPFPEAGLWRPWMIEAIGQADWRVVLSQGASVATVVVVGVLALLLNASGIELVANREVNLNRELRAAGVANIVAGLGGGLVGFHALSLTALAQRTGARSRVVGIMAGGVCLVGLFFGGQVMSLFPRPILGGLLLFLGLSFLVEWVIDAWNRLPRADHAVVLLILVVIAAFGFLEGVAVGLAVAVVLFVVNYSRTDVVKHSLTASTFRSNLDRSASEQEALRAEGGSVQVFQLQGFLFFGTANAMLERIRARAAEEPRLRFMVLDFRRVTGLDSSAVLSFGKAVQLAERDGFVLVVTDAQDDVRRQLRLGGVEEGERMRFFADLDRGVQWCEDRLLEGAGIGEERAGSLLGQLVGSLGSEVEDLLVYLERVEAAPGEEIIRQGDASTEIYFLESGRLTAQLVPERGDPVRLRTMGPGTVVGELAMYLGTPRSASVVAEEPSTLFRLPDGAFERMERDHPQAAAALHRYLARLLADRLSDTVRTMSSLLD